MAVDKWQYQEGIIVHGLVLGFATAGSTIVEGDFVTYGTSANEQVVVIPATSAAGTIGDGFGYALKAAGTGEKLPVAITGIVKVSVDETLVIGDIVLSESATDVAAPGLVSASQVWNGGTQRILGTILQAAETPGTEVLMILGLCR
jgi:hypothetical protein